MKCGNEMYILHCSLLESFKTFYLCIVQLSLQQISWRRKKTSCNANNSEFSLELIDPLDCDGIACENASQLYYFWFKNIWLCRIIKRLRFFFRFSFSFCRKLLHSLLNHFHRCDSTISIFITSLVEKCFIVHSMLSFFHTLHC